MVAESTADVSIVILSWNQKEYLKKCIESIMATTDYDTYRIIVIDNNSTDGAPEMVRENFEDVTLIENETNDGWAIGNNIGIEYTLEHHDPDGILLLNSDVEVEDPDWLSTLVEHGSRDGVGVVGCRLRYPDGDIQHAGARVEVSGSKNYTEEKYTSTAVMDEREYVLGACFYIDVDIIDDIGYLDEMYRPFNWEECDFCMRCQNAGYDIVYTPETELIHHSGKSKDGVESGFDFFVRKKNQIRYMLLYFSALELLKRTRYELKDLALCFVTRDGSARGPRVAGLGLHPDITGRLTSLLRAYGRSLVTLPDIARRRFSSDVRVERRT